MLHDEIAEKLGHLKGQNELILQQLKRNTQRLDDLERKSAVSGAVSGGLISVGVAVIAAAIQRGLHGGP